MTRRIVLNENEAVMREEARTEALQAVAHLARAVNCHRRIDRAMIATMAELLLRYQLAGRNRGVVYVTDLNGAFRTLTYSNMVSWAGREWLAEALRDRLLEIGVPEFQFQRHGAFRPDAIYVSCGPQRIARIRAGVTGIAMCGQGVDGVHFRPGHTYPEWYIPETDEWFPGENAQFLGLHSLIPKRAATTYTPAVQLGVWKAWLACALARCSDLPTLVLVANGVTAGTTLLRVSASLLNTAVTVARSGSELTRNQGDGVCLGRVQSSRIALPKTRVPTVIHVPHDARVTSSRPFIALNCGISQEMSVEDADRLSSQLAGHAVKCLHRSTLKAPEGTDYTWRYIMARHLRTALDLRHTTARGIVSHLLGWSEKFIGR